MDAHRRPWSAHTPPPPPRQNAQHLGRQLLPVLLRRIRPLPQLRDLIRSQALDLALTEALEKELEAVQLLVSVLPRQEDPQQKEVRRELDGLREGLVNAGLDVLRSGRGGGVAAGMGGGGEGVGDDGGCIGKGGAFAFSSPGRWCD